MAVNDPDPTRSKIQLEILRERQRHSDDRIRQLIVSVSISLAILSIIGLLLYIVIQPHSPNLLWGTLVIVIITLGFGVFQVFDKVREVTTKRGQDQIPSLKITLEVNGKPITIETSDTERLGEILELIPDLQTSSYPRAKLKAKLVNEKRPNSISSRTPTTSEAKEEISVPPGDTSEQEVPQKSEADER